MPGLTTTAPMGTVYQGIGCVMDETTVETTPMRYNVDTVRAIVGLGCTFSGQIHTLTNSS